MADTTAQEERGIKSASVDRAPRTRKKVKEIRVSRGEDGGHVVEHHYEQPTHPSSAYHEPTTHVFGATEGDKLVHHFVKKMKISAPNAYNPPSAETSASPAEGEDEEE